MGIAITRIGHVKLPVTDLERSVGWYRALLDLKPAFEFVEDGVLRGVILVDPASEVMIALRDRSVCASKPDLHGFDAFSLRVPSREVLQQLVGRCQQLGVDCTGIVDRGIGAPGGDSVVDVPDPDGTVIRFQYAPAPFGDRFLGLELGDGGVVGTYDTPRLA